MFGFKIRPEHGLIVNIILFVKCLTYDVNVFVMSKIRSS